jgi:carnosine N-methyltransferase
MRSARAIRSNEACAVSPRLNVGPAIAFICPRPACRGRLEDLRSGAPQALVCAACGDRYPLIAGELPVLTQRPDRHLATEAIRLRRELDWFGAQDRLLAAGQRRFPSRAAKHDQMRQALAQTTAFLDEILATILPHLDQRSLLDVAAAPATDTTAYGARQLCALLRRDFSGEASAEAEITCLTTAVQLEMNRATATGGPTLVLGCGTGRLAEELAAAGNPIVALDLSPLLLVATLLIRRAPRALCHFQTRNALRAEDQAHGFKAQRRAASGRPAVTYAVADAAAMPFPDGAFPRIVSVYFTDVIPLSKLLPELWRLLAPGGQFIHVGPLGYHFEDPTEHHAADELVDELRFSGFDVLCPRYVPGTLQATTGSLYAAHFDNLVFSAFKTATSTLRTECPAVPFVPRR